MMEPNAVEGVVAVMLGAMQELMVISMGLCGVFLTG